MNFRFDSPDLAHLERSLRTFAERGVPHAAKNALNATAFEARREWVKQIKGAFTLRRTWTTRSVRVSKARGTNTRRMMAVVGSIAPYMAEQESGATHRKSGQHGVAIPTSVSSGEGRGATPRRRVVRRPNSLRSITLSPRASSTMSLRRRMAVTIAMARKAGRKHVFLDMGRRKGIFKLAGRKRSPRVDMVWDLSRSTVRIPASRTLERTLEAIKPRLPALHRRALMQQLRRHRVPGF